MPIVVAAVINFEGAARSVALVQALQTHRTTARLEVVVVDDASSRVDVEQLRAALGSTPIIERTANGGYAAAANTAADHAIRRGAALLWLLNNDLDIEPGVLDRLVATLQATGWAAVAPVTTDATDGTTILGAGADLQRPLARVRHRGVGRPRETLPATPYPVDIVEGACPLIDLRWWRRIGGWDEGFHMYWEDVEWSVRARRAGAGLGVDPEAVVRHAVGASSTARARTERMLRNRVRFVRVTEGIAGNAGFLAYFVGLWLPGYTIARLIPAYGLRNALALATGILLWNVRDAWRRRRWRLRLADQGLPEIPPSPLAIDDDAT